MTKSHKASAVGFSRVLGVRDAVALGLATGIGVGVFASGSLIWSVAGDDLPLIYALTAILFLPIVLSYIERAQGRPGSASAYQLSRSDGAPWRAFFVGWLILGGSLSVAALLAGTVGEDLDVGISGLFGVDVDRSVLVLAVVGLAALNELIGADDRWRSRSILVWVAVFVFVGLILRVFFVELSTSGSLAETKFTGHDLAAVALLASSLWGVDLILNHRRQLRRPDRTMAISLLASSIGTCVVGAVAWFVVIRYPALKSENWVRPLSWEKSQSEMLSLLVSIVLCTVALSWTLSRLMRLVEAMLGDGFLPSLVGAGRSDRSHLAVRLLLISAVVVVLALPPTSALVGTAAGTFLWVTVLVMAPFAATPARELPDTRRFRLPLHPLFPGLAVGLSLLLIAVLPKIGLSAGFGWLVIGVIVYLAYGRRGSFEAIQRMRVLGEAETEEAVFQVLVAVDTDSVDPTAVIRVGIAVARAHDGEVLVLRVVAARDELSIQRVRADAEEEWEDLAELTASMATAAGVNIEPLVRMAPTIEDGVLATAGEYDVDLILLGIAAEGKSRGPRDLSSFNRIFLRTSRPIGVLQGDLPAEVKSIAVGTAGGPHAPVALYYADRLAGSVGASVECLAVVPRSMPAELGAEAIQRTMDKAQTTGAVEQRVAVVDNLAQGLLAETESSDVLVLGASIDRLLGQTVPGGLPAEVAGRRSGPTIVFKRAEKATRFWIRRLWEFVSHPLPTLTVQERSEVFLQMRHMARAGVDFYALISLAAAIAILGLLLDSAAVIIGAMLVAPLMSPILAMAHGIVQGNARMLRRAGISTFQGAILAIAVATVVTMLVPALRPTAEIMARVQPNLLDLMVALAAGAAAAYAVSRSSVAAALPGVAISVALVPPLCVVGYGVGSSNFDIAGGSLLLFLTNLVGIVLVGALVFLLLGFRPTRAERGAEARRGLLLATLSVILLLIPLGFRTIGALQKEQVEAQFSEMLAEHARGAYEISSLKVVRERGQLVVVTRIVAEVGVIGEALKEIQTRLQEEHSQPIRIRAAVVHASFRNLGGEEASAKESRNSPPNSN
ncbi:MAG: DUF389 domain-containing protein [Thermoanaerobaculia bacterium]